MAEQEQEFELDETLHEPVYKGFWIYGDQISGSSNADIPPEQWAIGFQLVAVPERWEEALCYWDAATQEVKLKGDRPSPAHYWDGERNEWVLPELPPIPAIPRWDWLTDSVRGSALFQRSYLASEQSTAVNAAFTLLMASLTTTRNLNDLRFAFARLRVGLQALEIDFSVEELEWLGGKLLECNFDPAEFDLG
ncbi:hypothetical protein [Leptolyngbya ohadii]|uniref:hypothetical protein n=1 Tax=Leptolyngbya ohadii TaxID=1962290 RepID=UPI000B59B384|nr:hypothetical protein [Leptolyngbya ohadii]